MNAFGRLLLSRAWMGPVVLAAMVGLSSCVVAGYDEAGDVGTEEEGVVETEAPVTSSLPVGTILAATANLNLRGGPSTSQAVKRVIPVGGQVTLQQSSPNNGFYQVNYQGTTGWAYGAYLKVVKLGGAATCASTASTGYYCGGDKVSNADGSTLYKCSGPGPAVVKTKCANGCVVAPAGQDDYCKAAAPTCSSTASTGDYCGGDKVDHGDSNTLYRCNGPGPATVKAKCANGCVVAPSGQDDYCKGTSSGGSSEYRAPWTCGYAHTCSNGNHTTLHDGKDEYGFDFAMPVGTTLRAMRGGTVLRVRKVSSPGGACYNGGGSGCANYANTVEVRHSDGTVALYMHLSTISVYAGQSVSRGSVIGYSGNSGYSTGPHLHVQVQQDCGIWWCQSVPFKFSEDSTVSAGTSIVSQNCN